MESGKKLHTMDRQIRVDLITSDDYSLWPWPLNMLDTY